MENFTVRIARRTIEADAIVSLELRSLDDAPLPAFSAGAHVDLQAPNGMLRQYSLCNSPAERERYVIAVLRDPRSRGGSLAIHDGLVQGAQVQISAPRNHFALQPATRSVLLAGGIGITPLLCMAEELAAAGADFTLHYCSRSPERTAFRERIAAAPYAGRVTFHYDSGTPEQRLDLDRLLSQAATGTRLYVCGPAGFIGMAVAAAQRLGWPDNQVHVEHFAGALVDTSHDAGFDIRIASTGAVFRVPADKSVARVLAENGIAIPMSCEEGVCGTCITRVVEGIPDHRDQYFTQEEQAANDHFMPCCSRAKSGSLVLDL